MIHKIKKVRNYTYISSSSIPAGSILRKKCERCQHYYDDNCSKVIIKMSVNVVKRTEVFVSITNLLPLSYKSILQYLLCNNGHNPFSISPLQ